MVLSLLSPLSVAAADIEQALWTERLLVLAAPAETDPLVIRQQDRLAVRADAIADRRLRIYELYADRGRINGEPLTAEQLRELRRHFGLAADSRELILVGLDGGIKRRARLDTPLSEVFLQIDGMPMRQQEIEDKLRAGLPVTPP
jgi:hypothetical protein